jgi:hypothetical protein
MVSRKTIVQEVVLSSCTKPSPMRILIAVFILLSFFQFCKQQDTTVQERVYICFSGTAYAYHDNRNCRGLRSCTHKIDTVAINIARTKYKRRPCGYCY